MNHFTICLFSQHPINTFVNCPNVQSHCCPLKKALLFFFFLHPIVKCSTALSLSTLFRGWITIKIPERIKYQARWEVLFISHFAGGMFTRFSSSLLVLKLPARDTNPLIHVSERRSAAGGDLTRKKSSSFIYQNSDVVSPPLNAVFNLISNSLSVLALRPNNIIPFNQWLINGVE